MSDEKPAPFTAGQILEGRYRIESILGVGGMGVVALAHHLHLDERVALKFILPERINDLSVVERFLIEARAAAKLKSEHAVRVFDAAKLPDGTPYLVMEYVEGEDLGRTLKRGPLEVEEAVTYILQASEALAEAHALGIVHRDLKPANLFLTRRPDGTPSIKVLDFGISKLMTEGPQQNLTSSHHVLGSPPYMSPEQLSSSKGIDHRTDIWALGVTLFELVTAKRPFGGGSLPEVCVSILTQPPWLAKSLRADLPPALDDVLAGCFEKEREHRFASLAEFADELLPLAPNAKASVERITRLVAGKGETSSPRLSDSEEVIPESTRSRHTQSIDASVVDLPKMTPPPEPVPVAQPRRRSTAVMIGTMVGFGALGAAAVALMYNRPPPSGPTGVIAAPPPSVTQSAMAIVSSPAPPASSVPTLTASAPLVPSTAPVVAKPRPSAPTRADQKGLAGDNPFK